MEKCNDWPCKFADYGRKRDGSFQKKKEKKKKVSDRIHV